MDLELTDEQRWLSEAVQTLLGREWRGTETPDAGALLDRRRRVWDELVAFGALAIGGEEPIGAVEACLIARSLGTELASAPFIGSAATRLALLSAGPSSELLGESAVAAAVLEPRASWALEVPATTLERGHTSFMLTGEKVAVEQADLSEWLAVVASVDGEPALALVPTVDPAVLITPRDSFDAALPMAAARLDHARLSGAAVIAGEQGRDAVERLSSAGALLAAAEAIGAAEQVLEEARLYASERRQFGHRIGSFQSIRHILADMYVRAASGWSAVLYAAAAFDEESGEAAHAASIAKAYVSRGGREIAHGAMQVFGGIAFTAEHPCHRFLRRIVVREQQFGNAAHHEQVIGRSLARRGGRPLVHGAQMTPVASR